MIAISKCIPSVRLQDLQTSCEILSVGQTRHTYVLVKICI